MNRIRRDFRSYFLVSLKRPLSMLFRVSHFLSSLSTLGSSTKLFFILARQPIMAVKAVFKNFDQKLQIFCWRVLTPPPPPPRCTTSLSQCPHFIETILLWFSEERRLYIKTKYVCHDLINLMVKDFCSKRIKSS